MLVQTTLCDENRGWGFVTWRFNSSLRPARMAIPLIWQYGWRQKSESPSGASWVTGLTETSWIFTCLSVFFAKMLGGFSIGTIRPFWIVPSFIHFNMRDKLLMMLLIDLQNYIESTFLTTNNGWQLCNVCMYLQCKCGWIIRTFSVLALHQWTLHMLTDQKDS